MFDVLTDRTLGPAKQLSKLLLVKSQRFGIQHHVDFGTSVFALVDQELFGVCHGVAACESIDGVEFTNPSYFLTAAGGMWRASTIAFTRAARSVICAAAKSRISF